jgi:hypothetical protein
MQQTTHAHTRAGLRARASTRLLKRMGKGNSNAHGVPNSHSASRTWKDMQQTNHAHTCASLHARASIRLIKRMHAVCRTPMVADRKWKDMQQATRAHTRTCLRARASIRLLKHMRAHTSNACRVPNSHDCTPQVERHAANHSRAHTRRPTCTRQHLSAQMHARTHQQPAMHAECQKP